MPYLVLDLEMTGPEPDYNEIIQIGAELYDSDENIVFAFDDILILVP